MKFSIKDFFSKCDQIRSLLRIWSHLLKKSLMVNLIFCVVASVNMKLVFLLAACADSLADSFPYKHMSYYGH